MTREQLIECPVAGCVDGQGKQKRVKRLGVHFRISHSNLDPAEFGVDVPKPVQRPEAEQAIVTSPAGVDVGTSAGANAGNATASCDQDQEPKPPAPFNLDTILSPLTDIIKNQQTAMEELKAQVERQAQDLSQFQQSAVGILNDMPNLIDRSLTSRLDQLAAQNQQPQPGANMPDPAALAAVQAGVGQDPKAAILMQLLPVIAQKLLGGEQQSGMGQVVNQLQGLGQLMQTIGNMQRDPWMQGAKFVTDVFATGARIGLTPDQTAASMTKTLSDMGGQPTRP